MTLVETLRREWRGLVGVTACIAFLLAAFGWGLIHQSSPSPTSSSHVQSPSLDTSCSWHQGSAVVTCRIVLTNSGAGSGDEFDWQAYSLPSGARFVPASGSLALGKSTVISVELPVQMCPAELLFRDVAHDRIIATGGDACPPLPTATLNPSPTS